MKVGFDHQQQTGQVVLYADAVLTKYDYQKYKHCIVVKAGDTGVCPVCGEEVVFYDKSDWQSSKRADTFIESIKAMSAADETVDSSHNEDVDIKQYLENLIAISQNIYILENRLKDLFVKRGEPDRFSAYGIQVEEAWVADNNKALEDAKRKLASVEATPIVSTELSENQISAYLEDAGLFYPARPEKPEPPVIHMPTESELIMPEEPTYKTSSLFNKKKIEEENKTAREEYENRIEKYNVAVALKKANDEAVADYERSIAEYPKLLEEYERSYKDMQVRINTFLEQKKKDLTELAERNNAKKQEQIAELKGIVESIEKKLENKDGLSDYYDKPFESGLSYEAEKAQFTIIESEIDEIEDLLLSQYNCLESLLAPEIIFSKYNDIVAWNTMYEYFITGRVTELAGPNGAYNLYESELRANTIISKLDNIIERLDAIRDNQYMLYKSINDANDTLKKMSDSMSNITELITQTNMAMDENFKKGHSLTERSNEFLQKINRSSEAIAYNTEKTAAYSRITAKTNTAIAFMKAIWG